MVIGIYVLNIWGIHVDQWYGDGLLCAEHFGVFM